MESGVIPLTASCLRCTGLCDVVRVKFKSKIQTRCTGLYERVFEGAENVRIIREIQKNSRGNNQQRSRSEFSERCFRCLSFVRQKENRSQSRHTGRMRKSSRDVQNARSYFVCFFNSVNNGFGLFLDYCHIA